MKIGYNFRRDRDNKDTPLSSDHLSEEVSIVQSRDMVSLCHSSFSNLQKVQVPDIKDKYYLSMNEILLSIRKQDTLGKDTTKGILSLATELFTNNMRK